STRGLASPSFPYTTPFRSVDEASAAGVKLAVCTTSAAESVAGVLDLLGPERKARFEHVLAGDVVKSKKPDPEIYLLARERLGLRSEEHTSELQSREKLVCR